MAGIIDKPDERKVHRIPTPRVGGVGIFLAFITSVLLGRYMFNNVLAFAFDLQAITFGVGAFIIFAIGLLDDARCLSAKVKLLTQIVVASMAFTGGIRIDSGSVLNLPVHSLFLDYCVTVFWFVLFINAINLIDGLDGLAGGVAFFACAMLSLLLLFQNHLASAMCFAALGGGILGFLRYNFNHATVFMGDGGSYFLGYAIAGLSIIGSAKAQTGALVLIPVLAMGVPVFDTILSPIRRFIIGKKLFQPDKSHIHHKLIELGLSRRNVVLLIYAISVTLCVVSLLLVNIRDRGAGILLAMVGLAATVSIRKLGYFSYFRSDTLVRWFKDIMDVAGLSHQRRSFLGIQIEISESLTYKEMWKNVCRALESINFDAAEFFVMLPYHAETKERAHAGEGQCRNSGKRPGHLALVATGPENNYFEYTYRWLRDCHAYTNGFEERQLLRVSLPIVNGSPEKTKTLVVYKDLRNGLVDRFILRRIGQLQETMIATINKIERTSPESRSLETRGASGNSP